MSDPVKEYAVEKKNKVRQLRDKARYDRATVHAILDAGLEHHRHEVRVFPAVPGAEVRHDQHTLTDERVVGLFEQVGQVVLHDLRLGARHADEEVLGLDAPEAELSDSFALAAKFPLVKGFAVGRTIFGQAARDWMAGKIDDDEAVRTMKDNYMRLCRLWDAARAEKREKVA